MTTREQTREALEGRCTRIRDRIAELNDKYPGVRPSTISVDLTLLWAELKYILQALEDGDHA